MKFGTIMNATIEPVETISEAIDVTSLDNPKNPVCVWLVDDDNEFRGLLAETLARQEGIDCARDFS